MADILRFTPEVPVEVALKYPAGKLVQGHNGPDMMFTLVDGRLMFLAEAVAAQLDALRIAPGEPFWITRNAGKSGVKGSVSWDIRRPNAGTPVVTRNGNGTPANGAPPIQWPEEAPAAPANGNGTNRHAVTSGNGYNADVRTQAESAILTALEACAKGEKYAASVGYFVKFTSEDARAIAITILIGAQQNGGRR